MQQWQDDLNARLKGKQIPLKYWEFPELEKGNIHQQHCAYCININCIHPNCSMTSCKFGCGARHHLCKTSEHLIICSIGEVEDFYSKMYQGVSGEQRRSSGASSKPSMWWSDKYFLDSFRKINEKRKSIKNCANLLPPKHFKSIGDLFEGPNEIALFKNNRMNKSDIPDPPYMERLAKNTFGSSSLALNLNFSSEAKHLAKSRAVYSFSCSQAFRRDEFGWHSKNVHDDIIGGLHNWMEHRCPLASYGCGFSVRRMHPKLSSIDSYGNFFNSVPFIVYSPIVESFGISQGTLKTEMKTTTKKKGVSTPNDLPSLPCEILHHIFDYLDSFR